MLEIVFNLVTLISQKTERFKLIYDVGRVESYGSNNKLLVKVLMSIPGTGLVF